MVDLHTSPGSLRAGCQCHGLHRKLPDLGCHFGKLDNYANVRSVKFDYNRSTTWTVNTVNLDSTFALGLETNLGYSENGLYGYDTIALSWQGSGGKAASTKTYYRIIVLTFKQVLHWTSKSSPAGATRLHSILESLV